MHGIFKHGWGFDTIVILFFLLLFFLRGGGGNDLLLLFIYQKLTFFVFINIFFECI